MTPKIAIAPEENDVFAEAVRAGGGTVVPPEEADGLIWIDPRHPAALADVLRASPARWVQLPFAGIESFFAAGVVGPDLTWTCAKGIYGPSTAEHALALLLAAARRLHQHARARTWSGGTFGRPERRLAGATVLIVGTGGIGRSLVAMLRPLEARVVAVNRTGAPLEGAAVTKPTAHLKELAADADYMVVAAALTPETRHLIDAGVLSALRSDAWLVNVARGGLVDTNALVDHLRRGAIGGAALDVTDPEPLPDDHPLWDLDRCIITPHVANTWDMALPELAALVRRNVERWGSGETLEGLVDPAAGY